MSVQVSEKVSSRRISNSGGLKGSREFFAYDDALTTPLLEDILAGDGMPSQGSPHPDTPNLLANNYTMAPSGDRSGGFDITWNYLPFEFPPPTEEELPTDPPLPFVNMETTLSTTLVDMWRSNPTVPQGGEPESLTTDIGGIEEHLAGYPVSKVIPQVTISVSNTITAGTVFAGALVNAMGKRNASPFMGLPAGSVLYLGSTISRQTATEWTVAYEFAADPEWFHMRQFPKRNVADGELALDDTADPKLPVYWRQPFPDTIQIDWVGQVG